MKKIAILLLISSSFLIQNSFSTPASSGRYKPCTCMSVMLGADGRVHDCCGNLLGTYPHLAQPSVHDQVAEKALKTEECLQTCINRSWVPALSKKPSETIKAWEKRITNHSDTLNKSCQSNLKSYLKKPTNTLDSWCKLQNSRPTAK